MIITECIERVAKKLERAGLSFGHGTDNPSDEAAWLVLHAVGAPLDGSFDRWEQELGERQLARVERLLEARCSSRRPLAYLIGTARFAGLEFEVDENVLVPRSPLAELILEQFRPWADPERINRVLDMCTGSGCIAIATAVYLPGAKVDAADISEAALAVADRNRQRHRLAGRVSLIRSDLFRSVAECRYDLIVSNPPYVPVASMADLPQEYRAEPGLGLVSGADGLDAVLSILVDAPRFLSEHGVLVCEVGESAERLQACLPGVSFIWLEFEHGGSGVFVLDRAQLAEAHDEVAGLIRERMNVV
ncbi:MAG: 50S ribosomal protein L3 N(5)-glutamine methyltransferase [Xanthomonadales bacterium]|nr:50S ribosomal protein L3 N(5)-glutamine methyltransferase [Gammaproteobacteria bacterium]MBT8054699.1 50S ribosomal protein L3 N(5)-glutamine methyltransferase [Gammaproteobacteria bacterium]NND57807.1 50S ribosomal protein L3 N(5)-glutamine methyltransferase [Xanthomonadales bacterium]NNJ80028.1 50S ribosomal protein L3 N(5)-glutamine methyltransferase [Xanthomonadales bacterium]NNK51456.1 50S ribosomal protein L3 N(5)-glutamine methyltransferase [Xanthomonadales bacterium]